MRVWMALAVLAASVRADDSGPAGAAGGPQLSAAIERAIGRGVAFLKESQEPEGHWRVGGFQMWDARATAHVLWALAANGVPADDPVIVRGVAWTEKSNGGYRPGRIYATRAVAHLLIALTRLDASAHRKRIHALARRLERAQRKNGMWGRTLSNASSPKMFDSSATQHATLALWTAERHAGYEPHPRAWKRMLRHFSRSQNADGSWGKRKRIGGWRVQLTTTGLFAVLVSDASLQGGPGAVPAARASEAARKGRDALTRFASYTQFISDDFLFGLDCAATFMGLPTAEWYVPRARLLLAEQGADGGWGRRNRGASDADTTASRLLFLSRAIGYGLPKPRPAITPPRRDPAAATAPAARFPERVTTTNLDRAFEAYLLTSAADRAPLRPRFATAGRAVIGFLIEHLGDPERQVRAAAHELLRALLAREFPFDPAASEEKRQEQLQPIAEFWKRDGPNLTWNAERGRFELG
jgi:hypothetical protein